MNFRQQKSAKWMSSFISIQSTFLFLLAQSIALLHHMLVVVFPKLLLFAEIPRLSMAGLAAAVVV
jgi:hypothetical protein